ncbi:hypothetical protein TcG_12239, partial [Trypanosoma cruzi]
RVHPHPSPRRPQQPNSQPPKNRCGNHTPAPKHATQHHVTWTPPSEERRVNRLAGTRYNRSTEQRSRTGTQSRNLHAHSPFDAAAAATETVPERKMTRSKKPHKRETIHTSICKAPLRLLRLQGPWAKMRLTESRQLCQSPLPPM